jgi:hypothetical protein
MADTFFQFFQIEEQVGFDEKGDLPFGIHNYYFKWSVGAGSDENYFCRNGK